MDAGDLKVFAAVARLGGMNRDGGTAHGAVEPSPRVSRHWRRTSVASCSKGIAVVFR